MKQGESGQALVATAILALVLVVALAWVANMGELFNRKTRMQVAADVAASAGGAAMAGSLNTLKISNLVLVGAAGASGLATLLGHAEGHEGVKAIEAMQEAILKADGHPYMALAYKVGMNHGAKSMSPLNFNAYLGDFENPSLDAERKRTNLSALGLSAMTGWSGKVVMDKVKKDKRRPYGDRYVYIAAVAGTDDLQGSRLFPVSDDGVKHKNMVSSSLSVVTGGKLWPLGGFFGSEMAPVSVLKRWGFH